MSWSKENWWRILLILFFGVLAYCALAITKELVLLLNNTRYNQDKLASLELDKESRYKESEAFDRKIKCQDMIDKFKKRYNNVSGGSYDATFNTCEIEYKDGGKKETSNMEFMSDN